MKQETLADIDRAISNLQALRAKVEATPYSVSSLVSQAATAAAYIDFANEAGDVCSSLIVEVAQAAAFSGNSSISTIGCKDFKAGVRDMLDDVLFDAREWCGQYGQEAA